MFNRILVTGGSGFIGSNVMDHYLKKGASVLNIDPAPPRNPQQASWSRPGDLLTPASFASAIRDFAPDLVIHLGARTDLDGAALGDYRANTDGLRNLLDVLSHTGSVRRAVFASSLLVCRLGYQPVRDDDYCPNTPYGESKVIGERILREARNLDFTWSIIRPTSIWGPWFGAPYRSFFEAVARRLYVHPKGASPLRSYGFVLNSVAQIAALAEAPHDAVHARTFYIADYEPIDLRSWAAEVSKAYGHSEPLEVPAWLLRAGARFGDALKRAGMRNPPLTSFRLNNLLTPAVYDLSATRAVCPDLPYDMRGGVQATVSWLRSLQRTN